MPYNATFCHIWSENITFHPASPTKTPPQGSDLKFSISLTGSSRVGRCKHCYTDPLLLKGTYLVFIGGQCANCYQLLLRVNLCWFCPWFPPGLPGTSNSSLTVRASKPGALCPPLLIRLLWLVEVDWDKNTHWPTDAALPSKKFPKHQMWISLVQPCLLHLDRRGIYSSRWLFQNRKVCMICKLLTEIAFHVWENLHRLPWPTSWATSWRTRGAFGVWRSDSRYSKHPLGFT